MTKAKPKPQPQPQSQGELLDCDPDPLADIFSELQDEQQLRAQQNPLRRDPVIAARVEAVRTAYDTKRAEIAAEQEGRAEVVPPMIWKGHVYELAQHIETIYKAGHLVANSLTHAFEQACKHYVQLNGEPISARSLDQSLRQKREAERGKK